MAASDAQPQPKRNTALRIQFGLWLTTGLINSGAAGLDSEISKDSGTFADCTAEATEVATSSGTYYLDLTATEMDADIVSIQVKSSTTNAITYKCTIYPTSAGDWGAKLDDGVAHGGTLGSSTATLALSRMSVVSQSSNTAALTLTGNGTGAAGLWTGGATGIGLNIVGGGTSGDGIKVTTTSGHGINLAPVGSSMHGMLITGGNGGTSDGLKLVAGTGGVGLRADTVTTSGAVTFNSFSTGALSATTITASGAVAFQSTFAVTTSSSLGALSCTTLTASGAVAFQSTFAVTTSTALAALSCSTFAASGTVTFNAFTVTNNMLVSGTTTHTGAVSFGSTFGVTGTTTLAALTTTGTTTFNAFTVSNATTLTGAVSLGSTLGVTGTTTLAAVNTGAVTLSSLTITNDFGVGGDVNYTGDFNVGNLAVTTASFIGNVAMAGGLTITQSTSNQPAVSITGNGTGNGVSIFSGNGATGSGLFIQTASTNGTALVLAGTGGGHGLNTTTFNCAGIANIGGATTITSLAASGAVTATNASNDIRGVSPTETDGAVPGFRIVDQGTAQSATSTTVVIRAASAFGTNTLAGMVIAVFGSTQGYWQTREISANVTATDTVTVAAWSVTPTGTITYKIFGTVASGGGSGLTAQQTRDAMQLSPTGVTQANSIDDKLDNLAAAAGTGAFTITVTVTDGTDPLENARVRVIEGINNFVSDPTDANGQAQFALDAATYDVAVTKDGYQFTPTTRTVTGGESGTLVNDLEMTQVAPNPPPAEPNMCVIYGYIRDAETLEMIADIEVTATLTPDVAAKAGGVWVGRTRRATTNSAGYFSISVPLTSTITPSGTQWIIECNDANFVTTQTLNASTFDIGTAIT